MRQITFSERVAIESGLYTKQCMKEIAEVLNKKLGVIIIQHWSNLQILQAACYKNAPDFAEM